MAYQSREAYVGPANTSSELHPDSHTGRHARFASIDDWSMQALSSQIRQSPPPRVAANFSTWPNLRAPASDQLCETKAPTSPILTGSVWSKSCGLGLLSVRSSTRSDERRSARKLSSAWRRAVAAERPEPPRSAATAAASCCFDALRSLASVSYMASTPP